RAVCRSLLETAPSGSSIEKETEDRVVGQKVSGAFAQAALLVTRTSENAVEWSSAAVTSWME
ncbi:hypothetical protein H0H81_011941, partial [Sphagnurus paluster]